MLRVICHAVGKRPPAGKKILYTLEGLTLTISHASLLEMTSHKPSDANMTNSSWRGINCKRLTSGSADTNLQYIENEQQQSSIRSFDTLTSVLGILETFDSWSSGKRRDSPGRFLEIQVPQAPGDSQTRSGSPTYHGTICLIRLRLFK
jgi:hypothetical protein